METGSNFLFQRFKRKRHTLGLYACFNPTLNGDAEIKKDNIFDECTAGRGRAVCGN